MSNLIKKIKEEINTLEKEMERLLEEEDFNLSLYKEKEKRISYLSFLLKDLKKVEKKGTIHLGHGLGAFIGVI
jgi:hypothetical protein